jgi:hypothetical protein
MPWYFRFGFGPFRFSQRVGRTQAQQRAAAKARAERQDARDRARRQADRDRRSFGWVPAHDVTHGADGSVSFTLDPPGFPQLHVNLEDGHFGEPGEPGSMFYGFFGEDFTGLREGDRVHGTVSRDGHSLEDLSINVEDHFRYTCTGWAEDIKRQPDGSTMFTVVFPADPDRFYHPKGREPLEVTLQPGEKVRWKDGRPYRMREGSELTVVLDPDGGPPAVYHEKYG